MKEAVSVLEIIKAIIFGIVEGITEWLPISSTGHMILVNEFIQLNVSKEFMEMFLVVIQLGAILAVVVLYFWKLWPFTTPSKGWIKKDTWSLWFKVIVAVLPAALIGIPFDDQIDALFYNYQTVAATLIIYGVLFIIIENRNRHRTPVITTFQELSYSHRSSDRRLPGTFPDSRNLPLRRYDSGSHAFGNFPLHSRGVQLLSGNSGHVRSQPSEACEIRF